MKLSVIAALAILAAGPVAQSAFAQPPAATTTAQDKAIGDRIARAIAADPSLKADAVKVSVDDGVATLSGVVANEADKAKAGRLAKVDGVIRVENKLTTHETMKDKTKGTAGTVADKSKEGAKSAGEKTKDGAKAVGEKTKEGVSKTGEVITDAWITSRISTKYVGEDLLKDSNIDVDTNDHVVTLNGTVLSAAGKARAEALAKEVEGVKSVVNKLVIGPKK
jgi:hyperosmotically inducible periplasmic protein